MESLKQKILDKKELRSLDKEFLEGFFEEEISRNKKLFEAVERKKFNDRSKEFKELKKIIRKRLREVYGVFTENPLSKEKREKLMEELKEPGTEEQAIKKILEAHLSSKERLPHYGELYGTLFTEEKPNKILDLGCGYNPFSYGYLGFNPEYVASDVSQKDLEFIQKFFETKKIPGKTIKADLAKEEDLKKIIIESKKAGITFALKLLDTLEATKKGSSENLLLSLKSPKVLVSFPKKSISGKNLIKSERKWFQNTILKLLEKGYNAQIYVFGDEEYFLLTKKHIKKTTINQ